MQKHTDNTLKEQQFQSFITTLDSCRSLNKHHGSDSCIDYLLKEHTLPQAWINYGKARVLADTQGLKAIELINKSLSETESEELLYERAKLLQLRSLIYVNNNKLTLAADDLYKASDIFLALNLTREAVKCFNGISTIQFNAGNYSLAIENSLHVLDLSRREKPILREDSLEIMRIYNTLGISYYMKNNLDSAQKYYEASLALAHILKDEFWSALVNGNAARIYATRGMADLAIEKYKEDIIISLKYNELGSAAAALLSVGETYTIKNQPQEAKRYYDSSFLMAKRIGSAKLITNYYRLVANWYEQNGNLPESYRHFKKYVTLRDSINTVQTSAQLQHVQDQRQFEKQLSDINLLTAENQVKERELRIKEISMIAFVIIAMLLSGLLYSIRRANRKLNALNNGLEIKVKQRTAELIKTNKELDTYLYRASHDVRGPILSIIGLSQLMQLSDHEAEKEEIRQKIADTAKYMDKMLQKLQMAYEVNKLDELHDVNLYEFMSSAIDMIRQSHPETEFSIKETAHMTLQANPRLLAIVFNNILENACIFSKSDDKQQVNIEIEKSANTAQVTIKDNGIGIAEDYIDKIFDAYTRFSDQSTGSGLGLYLALKAIKTLGGEILVESKPYYGSVFTCKIPLSASN